MEDRERVPQYKTIKRLQKKYLVRCNESLSQIIKGDGVKPVSAMRRYERQIAALQKQLGKCTERQILVQETPPGQGQQQARQQAQEILSQKEELIEQIKKKQEELRKLELQ